MKRSVTLIVGAAVVVVLVGVLILVKNLPKKAPPQKPTITLSSIASDKIAAITLKHNGDTVTLKQVDKKWTVDSPNQYNWDTSGIQSIVNSFTSLVAQREVEKNPTDLAQFGLNPPAGTAVATLTDGSKVTLEVGNKIPTGTGYYMMKAGEKPLYTVATYHVTPLLSTLNSLRNTQLTSIDTKKLTYLKITNKGETIEIKPIPKNDPLEAVSFSQFEMVQPYKVPHAVDTSKLNAALKQFPSYLTIQSFVNDHPTQAQLSSYGLSPAAATIVMKDDKNTLDIEIGDPAGNSQLYAKLPGKPSVFTVNDSDFKSLLDTSAFTLLDKFLLIPNIDNVDGFSIKTASDTYTAVISRVPEKGAKPDSSGKTPMKTTYILNGKTVPEQGFKNFYQAVIGLLADSPNPKPNVAFNPEITVTFHINKGPQHTYHEYFVPYNRDFYAVFIDGSSQLLLDRSQVKSMITSAQDLLSGKKSSNGSGG